MQVINHQVNGPHMKAEGEGIGDKFYLYSIQKGLSKGYCNSLKNLYLRPLSLKYITLWSYYDDSKEEIDYCVLIDDIIALYDEYEDVVAYHAMLKTQYIISLQAESQKILTRDDSDCEYPGAGDSLQPATSYSMSNFRWVKAWVGVYTSQTPLGLPYLYAQYCTTTQRTLLQQLAYANDTYGLWNVGSIQVKYFFLADQSTHQHNAIYEGNHSNNNLNGNYPVGGATVPFTNGVAWTYGVSYDGSSTPSNGTYKFTLYVDHLIYDDYPDCCCTPSYSPDDTTYDQWCNTHCGGCFACDDGGDQNFIISNS